jgi:hypothetical protein
MKDISKNKNSYSSIQYFFWLLSGAEIHILKDCPTDYNRQASIGFTIFMTTLLAFFSGSYAGYYFGESLLSAFIFGAIWASLIFSIDRSMVVTLKKDPTKEKQNFWLAFLSRGVLAILIAFIISIPLELLIFEENIELHMDKYKLDQVYNIQQAAKRNEAIDDKQRILSNDSLILGKVESELSNGEPKGDPEYDRLKSKIIIKQQEYDVLLNKFNIAQREAKIAYGNIPLYYDNKNKEYYKDKSSTQWFIYKKKDQQRIQAQGNFKSFDVKGLDNLKKQKELYIGVWIQELKGRQKKLNEDITKTSSSINRGLANADTISDVFHDKIQDKKGFILRFMILENLAQRYHIIKKRVNSAESQTSNEIDETIVKNKDAETKWIEKHEYNPEGATIFMLLWLIRILFFTIEILPTIAKIATPIGAYDRAIYRKEKDLELEFEQRTSSYLNQQQVLRDIEYEAEKEQVKMRAKIENNLHTEILTEIALVQNKIARDKIEEFKKRHETIK